MRGAIHQQPTGRNQAPSRAIRKGEKTDHGTSVISLTSAPASVSDNVRWIKQNWSGWTHSGVHLHGERASICRVNKLWVR